MFISITFEIVFSDSIELVKCFGYMYADAVGSVDARMIPFLSTILFLIFTLVSTS